MKKIKWMLLSIFFLQNSSFAQWTTNSLVNTPVETSTFPSYYHYDYRFETKKDNSGNIFIGWIQSTSTNTKAYIQKFNSNGISQWTANGIQLNYLTNAILDAQIVPDNAGGAYVSFNAGFGGIVLQYLNTTGQFVWGSPKVIYNSNVIEPRMISDGSGGVFIVWRDKRSFLADNLSELFYQHVNANGDLLLAANGVKILNTRLVEINEYALTAVQDGTNMIVSWIQNNGTTAAPQIDIMAQKINSAGQEVWSTGGIVIGVTPNLDYNMTLAVDQAHNLFAAWESYPAGKKGLDGQVYIQKINATGTLQWGNAAISAPNAIHNLQTIPRVAPDNNGGAFVTFMSFGNGVPSAVTLQKFNSAGITQLIGGKSIKDALSGTSIYGVNMKSDEAGGAYLSWYYGPSSNQNIEVQKISNSGDLLWNANGITVSSAADNQRFPGMLYNNDGVIVAWLDFRSGTNNDIYMQRVNGDGTLGPATVTAVNNVNAVNSNILLYPNPVIHDLTIENKSPNKIVMRLLGINGQIYKELSINRLSSITVNTDRLPKGVFMAEFTDGDGKKYQAKMLKQ